MKYYRLKVSFILNQDINFRNISRIIGYAIQKSMLKQNNLKILHDLKTYKYIFSPLKPFIMKENYEIGEHYYIYIQSFDENTIVKFNYSLNNYSDEYIKVTDVRLKEIFLDNFMVESLETVTPVIITIDNKPWKYKENSLDILIQKIYDNLEKKYNYFFGKEWKIKNDVNKYKLFENFELTNAKPIAREYKGIKLIGYKMRMNIGTSDIAQKLAKVAIVQGIGEKNAIIGSGYVKYESIRR